MADVLAVAVAHLKDAGFGPVYTEIPAGVTLAPLPCVGISPVGPSLTTPGLNTVGIDDVDLDIDLYVSDTYWLTGQADPLAQQLRHHMERLFSGTTRTIRTTRPVRRPDRNQNIRRLGFTITVRAVA